MNASTQRSSCILFAIVAICASTVLADEIDFSRDVRPILADNCYECHGPDEESREAELRLDVLDDAVGWVIKPGQPDASSLIERLLLDDPDLVMPPPHSKRRPTDEEIAVLRRWVQLGAEHEQHWAFVSPKRPSLPAVANDEWIRNPIDRFVLSHLESEAFTPRPDTAPRLLARRLSLALTGLPVLPERAELFAVAYETDPDLAVSALVDELLAMPAYGEHRAWFWMDAARYADTNGYQGDSYREMWPWRDWLIRALNKNIPFDELTEQMLAGDLLMPEEHSGWESADWIADDRASELLVATGFLRNHRYDTGSGTIPAESKFENAADRMETVGTVWMGMTMLCARCHTHKYDPIENREYYELLSFFDNVPEVGSALKGASHPYVHTPTGKQREELKRLRRDVIDAENAFVAAEASIRDEQSRWEQRLVDGSVANGPRVQRGLKFRFAEDGLQLDGQTKIEESNKPIALCAGNKQWSISFWFRPDSEKNGAIFSSVEEPERYRPGIQADWVNGRIRVRHVCRWVNSYIEFRTVERLNVGQWYHVTFRCDGRMQGLAYSASLNGLDTGMTCTHPVTNDSASKSGRAPLVIGNSPFLKGVVGRLRDLRFYDRELTKGEVASLADRRSTVDIARIPATERTAKETETLRLAFLDSDSLSDSLATIRERLLRSIDAYEQAVRETPTTMVMQERETARTRVRLAGVFDSLGDEVDTETPDFLPPISEDARDRLALARWLARPDHPLTARVAVNRIWQTLWGRGFVDSPENFGTQCAEPLHADLLDWLATEYIRLGWDTKALTKLIVTSRTYRQRSDAPDDLWNGDPSNRHLARGPRFRLPIHTVRDQALVLSGRLDETIGGPPVILDDVAGKDGKLVKLPFEKADNRRTLYTFWKRNSPHPMLAVFDVADRNQCEVRTMRTNTPLQALVTLNEPGFAASAEALARRVQIVAEPEDAKLRWLWQACTGRQPSDEQVDQLQAIRSRQQQLADGDESRSWTALCNILLNLDATLTLE